AEVTLHLGADGRVIAHAPHALAGATFVVPLAGAGVAGGGHAPRGRGSGGGGAPFLGDVPRGGTPRTNTPPRAGAWRTARKNATISRGASSVSHSGVPWPAPLRGRMRVHTPFDFKAPNSAALCPTGTVQSSVPCMISIGGSFAST